MSNGKMTRLITALATLGMSVSGLQNYSRAFDETGAAPVEKWRKNTPDKANQNGTAAAAWTGSAFDQNSYLTNDGRILKLDTKTLQVKILVAQDDMGQNSVSVLGDNANANNDVLTTLSSGYLATPKPNNGFQFGGDASAVDAIGTDVFVDQNLYLRTIDGKYFNSPAKKNSVWDTTDDINQAIKVSKGVLRTMPVGNPFKLESTFEYQRLQKQPMFYKEAKGKKYLCNDSGTFCDWLGKAVEEKNKVELDQNKMLNFLQLQDIPSELRFGFDQGQLAVDKGVKTVKDKQLMLVPVKQTVKVTKDGKTTKEKKLFLYSPFAKKYVAVDGKLVDKPDPDKDVLTDDMLVNLGITTPLKDVKTMKYVWWHCNVDDATWKQILAYGSLGATGVGLVGIASWAGYKAINKDKDAGDRKSVV